MYSVYIANYSYTMDLEEKNLYTVFCSLFFLLGLYDIGLDRQTDSVSNLKTHTYTCTVLSRQQFI